MSFESYFDVADEIYESVTARADQTQESPLDGPLTLADLDPAVIREARDYADGAGLPWPPYLPAAEEAYLDRRQAERVGRGTS